MDYDHEPFDDGYQGSSSATCACARYLRGHRPEHSAFLLIDGARGEEPWAVLTGDSLFVGDIARPDLAVEKEDGARGIFRSLHDKLLDLPDECEVWPGHLGGSLCGGPGMDMKVSSTIGFERRHNDLLAVEGEEEFVERSLAKLGPQPPNFQAIVDLNRGPLLTTGVEVLPLAPRQIEQRRAAGAMVVDVRTDLQFDEAHIPGAVSNTMLRAASAPSSPGSPTASRRSSSSAATTRTGRSRPARHRGWHPQARRLPPRGDDGLARRGPRRGVRGATRRARSGADPEGRPRPTGARRARGVGVAQGHIPAR